MLVEYLPYFWIGYFVMLAAYVFRSNGPVRRLQRRGRVIRREHEADAANLSADRDLWYLLKDTDPGWLAYMGIEDPALRLPDVRKQQKIAKREQAQREKTARELAVGPGQVVVVNPKPSTPEVINVGIAPSNVDREVEKKLEARLQAMQNVQLQPGRAQQEMMLRPLTFEGLTQEQHEQMMGRRMWQMMNTPMWQIPGGRKLE